MSEDMDDPDVRAGKLHQMLEAAIEEMYDMVNDGQRRWLDEAHLILVQGKIELLRGHMRNYRSVGGYDSHPS